MIEIIVTMCRMGTTTDIHHTQLLTHVETRQSCRAATKVFLQDPSVLNPKSCVMNAQKFAVEWLRGHPGYQVRAIKCHPKGEIGQEV